MKIMAAGYVNRKSLRCIKQCFALEDAEGGDAFLHVNTVREEQGAEAERIYCASFLLFVRLKRRYGEKVKYIPALKHAGDPFALYPYIRHGKVILHRIPAKDTGQVRSLYDQPLTETHACRMILQADAWFRKEREILLGIYTQDEVLVGMLELYEPDGEGITVGYRIMKRYRRGGCACDALEGLKQYCKAHTRFREIRASADRTNTASCALLEKCGFAKAREDGTICRYVFPLRAQSMIK